MKTEVTNCHRKKEEKKVQDEFNAITQKKKPVNQNQQHNVKEEGIAPINRKY